MSDLHERLLDVAESGHPGDGVDDHEPRLYAAVRAVVESHAPLQVVLAGTPDQFVRCPLCPGGCETTEAIAEALGVQIGETPS